MLSAMLCLALPHCSMLWLLCLLCLLSFCANRTTSSWKPCEQQRGRLLSSLHQPTASVGSVETTAPNTTEHHWPQTHHRHLPLTQVLYHGNKTNWLWIMPSDFSEITITGYLLKRNGQSSKFWHLGPTLESMHTYNTSSICFAASARLKSSSAFPRARANKWNRPNTLCACISPWMHRLICPCSCIVVPISDLTAPTSVALIRCANSRA